MLHFTVDFELGQGPHIRGVLAKGVNIYAEFFVLCFPLYLGQEVILGACSVCYRKGSWLEVRGGI